MLGSGDDAILLQSPADGNAHIGAEQHILAKGLDGPAPAAVPGDVHHGGQRLSDTDSHTFLADGVADLRNDIVIKGGGHTDGLGEGGCHTPLGAVEGFTMLNGRDPVGLGIHAQPHIPVDPFGNLRCRRSLGSFVMHKMTGVAEIAHSVFPLCFILLANRENHLAGKLIQLLLQGHAAQKFRSPLLGCLLSHNSTLLYYD